MDLTAAPRYRDYLRRFKPKPGGPQKPLSKDQWESKILGKPEGKKSPDKKDEKKAPEKSYKKKYAPNVTAVMDAHNLTDTDADEVKAFKAKKPASGVKLSPSELLQKFLAHAKPETKKRMKDVSPAEFVKMLGAIMDEVEGETGKTAAVEDGYDILHALLGGPDDIYKTNEKLEDMDTMSAKVFNQTMHKLAQKLNVTPQEQAAIGRLKWVIENVSHADAGLIRNNVFKAGNLMGVNLPSMMFASVRDQDQDLRSMLIKKAKENPELRSSIIPILRELGKSANVQDDTK